MGFLPELLWLTSKKQRHFGPRCTGAGRVAHRAGPADSYSRSRKWMDCDDSAVATDPSQNQSSLRLLVAPLALAVPMGAEAQSSSRLNMCATESASRTKAGQTALLCLSIRPSGMETRGIIPISGFPGRWGPVRLDFRFSAGAVGTPQRPMDIHSRRLETLSTLCEDRGGCAISARWRKVLDTS